MRGVFYHWVMFDWTGFEGLQTVLGKVSRYILICGKGHIRGVLLASFGFFFSLLLIFLHCVRSESPTVLTVVVEVEPEVVVGEIPVLVAGEGSGGPDFFG